MDLQPLLNRDGSLPADNWYHIVPRGEYPHPESKKLQVLDDKALDAIVNNFRPKLLIDQEHWSYEPERSSEAMGWLTEVQKRSDGLWGVIEWSDLGEAAVKNKRYRYISPAWLPRDTEALGKERLRPLRMDSAALTNKPNLRGMVPLSNRRDASASPAGSKPATTKNRTMNSVATKLGLSAEASEDAILAALTNIITERDGARAELTPLKNKVTELETANKDLLDAQIDADLDAHGIKDDGKRARLKPILGAMKNRADRVEFLKDIVAKPGTPVDKAKPVLNRADTKPPGAAPGDTADANDADLARQREKEVREYQLRNRCTHEQAWNAVRSDKPELFSINT